MELTDIEPSDIQYATSDDVAVATFQRPERLNAFRDATYQELLRVLDVFRSDDRAKALVLTGSGRAFCAGEDLKEAARLLTGEDESVERWRARVLRVQEITRRVVEEPKPILAAVNGIATGFGMELSIACDIRIAAEAATFSFAEVTRGLFVTNGVLFFLPRLIGYGRASELLLSGRSVPAGEAREMGLVSSVVPAEELLPAAAALGRTIGANSPVAVRLLKRGLLRAQQLDFEGVLQLEVDALMECLASPDAAEGLQAFVEKRPPRYGSG